MLDDLGLVESNDSRYKVLGAWWKIFNLKILDSLV